MEPGARITAVVALLLAAGVALPACGGGGGSEDRRPYAHDTPFAKRIGAFAKEGPHGATRRVDALTTFDWDTVYVFGEGARYRDVDREVGFELFGRDGRYYDNGGTLLVFTLGGKLAAAQALIPPVVLGADATRFARESAVLRARTPDPGPYALDLVEVTG